MRLSSRLFVLAMLALVAGASRSAAQTVVDPSTAVPAPAGGAYQVDVNGAFSGRYVAVAARTTGELLVERFADHQWDLSSHGVNFAGPVVYPMLRLDATGNFTAGWRDPFGVAVRYLDSVALPSGSSPVTINAEGLS